MSLSKLPANELIIMTEMYVQLFRAAGCEPTCHYCDESLDAGMEFKLTTWNDNDVMLCTDCTVTDLQKQKDENIAARELYLKNYYKRFGRYPGYSRPTQI